MHWVDTFTLLYAAHMQRVDTFTLLYAAYMLWVDTLTHCRNMT